MTARAKMPGRPSEAPVSAAGAERGTPDFIRALERVSRQIHDPVAKLRYIRATLARYDRMDRVVRRVPLAPVRGWIYRRLSTHGLRLAASRPPLGLAPSRSTARPPRLGRGVSLAAALGATAALATVLYRPAPGSAVAAAPVAVAAVPESAPAPPARPPVAEPLAPPALGVVPAAAWLVEKGDGWEQYSNGLRIDTRYAVDGDPRRYRVFTASGGLQQEVLNQAAGILFHTSESDLWPLEAEFNENLRDSSQRLLRYVRRLKLYHYVVDRFGRVYRIVSEDAKANHAGNSVWARDDRIYLSLNNAFFGICFETRWEGGLALPITQAQLAAGRCLTDYLRQRFRIVPDMVVAHGLTSVNPRKHLIGHHLDWARGFPFEAFGLPDQYLRPAPAVALFGFGYDDELRKAMGEPWPGVREAERSLAEEARRLGRPVDEVRRERRELYDRWLSEQALAEGRPPDRADREETGGTRGG
jgi:hypothetical protein